MRSSKLSTVLYGIVFCCVTAGVHADEFEFVALGDTAYNGERDYVVYRRLIEAINGTRPAFTIHVGDIWGIGNCHDWHVERIVSFFAAYDHPVIYTPGDNEWVDCGNRAMGGYDPTERLAELRKVFFPSNESLGKRTMALVRQGDVSPFTAFVENTRWERSKVLFATVNVSGSNNNFQFDDLAALTEAHERNRANVAWLRDTFRIARDGGHVAVVVALHAEMFEERGRARPAFAAVVDELQLGAERFGKPVLMINGDSHEFVVDRPLLEPRGEAELPRHANFYRLEVYGAPEIRAVSVGVDTKSTGVFSFRPLYVD